MPFATVSRQAEWALSLSRVEVADALGRHAERRYRLRAHLPRAPTRCRIRWLPEGGEQAISRIVARGFMRIPPSEHRKMTKNNPRKAWSVNVRF